MTQERQPTVRELWDAARRGMIWRNKPIEDKIDKLSILRLWIKEEDITPGIIAVKSSTLYDNCIKWCMERKVTNPSFSMRDFGSFLKANFRYATHDHSKHYFINKEIEENAQKKEERKKKYGKRKKPKEQSPQVKA